MSPSEVAAVNNGRREHHMRVAARIHEWCRKQGLITDAARDVPFVAAPSIWREECRELAARVTP